MWRDFYVSKQLGVIPQRRPAGDRAVLEKDGVKQCEWRKEGREGSYGIVALAHDLRIAPLTHTPSAHQSVEETET